MKKSSKVLTHRDMLKDRSVPGFAGTAPDQSAAAKKSKKKQNPVEAENSKPGTLEWQLQFTRFDDPVTLASNPLVRGLRSSVIEGFVSKTSVLPRESIDFYVSANPAADFTIDIYRMGYYGGTGGRHMGRIGTFKATPQAMPMMTVERLRECNWDKVTTLTIPNDWPSGVYLGKLSRNETFGRQSYVIFVVKERRKSDILFQVSDLTWQAYNKWPGRDSLYDDGTPAVWYTGPNVRVSFDRPYAKYCQVLDAPLSAGSGEFLLWEHPMVFWLEQQGYDVTYCSNVDLHLDPGILDLSKVLISIGHDEYWSRKMFEEVIKARDNGLSIAFFSGNSVCYEVNFFDNFKGDPCRSFSRDKQFEDEEKIMGNTSYGSGYGDWIVKKPEHWIYEGTGLKENDRIPAIIGWEYHGPPLLNTPNLEIVAEGPTTAKNRHTAVIYPGLKGNWVFNAGTIWWAEGLAQPPGHIPASTSIRTFGVMKNVQIITTNLLNRMIKDSPR